LIHLLDGFVWASPAAVIIDKIAVYAAGRHVAGFGRGVLAQSRLGRIRSAVEPRYKSLMVALVPQPRQMPPPPFDKDALQRVFAEVIQRHPYQSFGFLPTGRGAQFGNSPEDGVELRPALFQIQARMDDADLLTGPMAVDKVNAIFGIAAERLNVAAFLQCAIQVIA
jgi:hypothetical protein